MRQETDFSVRYLTEEPVPIRDIIESLQGVETIMGEVAKILPDLVDGIEVQGIEVRVREIAEGSLREVFAVALFLAFQKDLEQEVTTHIQQLTGVHIPPDWDTIVTVAALAIVFYGVGAIKDLVLGSREGGPSGRMLDGLIEELATTTGKTTKHIRDHLDKRYGDRTLWKRIANASSRFFTPSKRQESAAIEVNHRRIEKPVVQDVPAQYLLDHEADIRPARSYSNVTLELHAQDRDHSGRGWAAIPRGISDQRLRLRLMENVTTSEVWNHNIVRGDITMVYERVGTDMVPREIHLHNVTGVG